MPERSSESTAIWSDKFLGGAMTPGVARRSASYPLHLGGFVLFTVGSR